MILSSPRLMTQLGEPQRRGKLEIVPEATLAVEQQCQPFRMVSR